MRSIAFPRFRRRPTKVLATGFTECGGGMAANASVAVARLGGDAYYWGRVGADPLGRPDSGRARRRRCRCRRRCGASTGAVSPSAAILVDDDGERLVCAYNDPALDPRPVVASARHALAECRGGAGRRALAAKAPRAVLDAAGARTACPTVFDGDVGPSRRPARPRAARDLCRVFSSPVSRIATGESLPEQDSARSRRRPCKASSASRSVPTASFGAKAGMSTGCPRPMSTPSTPSPPATSGTARLRWRWRSERMSRRPAVSPTRRRRSSARAIGGRRRRADARRGRPAACPRLLKANKVIIQILYYQSWHISALPRPATRGASAPRAARPACPRSAASAAGRFAPSFANSASCDASSRDHWPRVDAHDLGKVSGEKSSPVQLRSP